MGKLGVSAGSRGLRALVAGAIIGSLLCVQGCAGADLPEGTWVVTSSEGHDLVEGTRPSMVLDGRGIRIDSGCNTLSGRVGYSHGVLSAKDLTSTLIGCDPDRLAQEEWLTEFFSAGAEVALQGDTMTLTQDRVTLTLERESSPSGGPRRESPSAVEREHRVAGERGRRRLHREDERRRSPPYPGWTRAAADSSGSPMCTRSPPRRLGS